MKNTFFHVLLYIGGFLLCLYLFNLLVASQNKLNLT